MEYSQITKSVLGFQKMSFDTWYNTMAMMQDQAASTMGMMLHQTPWIPEDGRQDIQGLMETAQEERNRFKSYVDDRFAEIEKTMVGSTRKATEMAKKAS